MMICQYWIVIANASYAAIYCVYSKKSPQKLNFVGELSHLQSRMKKKDLVADAPGYSRAPMGKRGVHEERSDIKKIEADHFAKEVAGMLSQNLMQSKFKSLLLAAPSHFYNLLDKYMNKQCKNALKKVLKKDYSRLSVTGLEKVFFQEVLPRKVDQLCTKRH